MTAEPALTSEQQAFTSLTFLSPLYFIAVGTFYLWGYWSPFNINILEYLGITDIVKAAAYPVASSFAFLAFGALIGEFIGPRSYLPSGGGTNSPVAKFLRKHSSAFWICYILITLAILFLAPSQKWQFVLPVLFALPLTSYVTQRKFLSTIIPSEQIRSLCVFLLAILPFYAYGQGRQMAEGIIGGSKYDYVLSPIDGVSIYPKEDFAKNPRFIGHASDSLFFWQPQNSTLVISKMQEGKPLVIGRHSDETSSSLPK